MKRGGRLASLPSPSKRFYPGYEIGWIKCSVTVLFNLVAEHCSMSISKPGETLLEGLCSAAASEVGSSLSYLKRSKNVQRLAKER